MSSTENGSESFQEEILRKGIQSDLKGRFRFLNMWQHDVVQRWKIRRKALAKEAGLDDDYDVGSYPESRKTIGDTVTVVDNSLSAGKLAAIALVVASLLTGGSAAGWLAAASLLSGKAVSVQSAPDTPLKTRIEREVWDADVDMEVEPPK